MKKYNRFIIVAAVVCHCVIFSISSQAAKPRHKKKRATPNTRITRLVWKDFESQSLRWSDIYLGNQWKISPQSVAGFPQIDPEKQNLVQMKQVNGKLVVGVRDKENGSNESGWIAVNTGVSGVSHGFHMDFTFSGSPRVVGKTLNNEQGNPAHLYVYDETFYLANDRLNGFTQIAPKSLASRSASASTFYSGGGNHITMAAVNNQVAYSSWIDRAGPQGGQVDVIDLRNQNQSEKPNQPAYSFHLPTGGIHGATANSGKVFLAPLDGICWVDADLKFQQTAETVKVHHLELGKDSESGKPLRTGAFCNHRSLVLFSTGRTDSSALCFVDASLTEPKVNKVLIDVADGLSLSTPKVTRTKAGKRYVFMFQERAEGEGEEYLSVVDLDPNGDLDFDDAKVIKKIKVGASKITGHYGHHDLTVEPDGRYAFISNPGDGSLSVLSLRFLKIVAEFDVKGVPTSLLAIGGIKYH